MTAPTKTQEEITAEQQAADAATAAAEAEDAAAQAAEAALGDKGKQALDRMKAERNSAKAELAKYTALGLAPDKLQELIGKSAADATAAEQERVRRDAETAALSKANDRLLRAEVKAAATGKLRNPALALRLLDLSSFDVDDDGEVDTAAITAAIDELLKEEPGLGVTQGDGKRFQGSGDVGAKGAAGKPQLTKADVERLAKEGKHAEIEQARIEGRLNTLLGITT